jgi:hypothetical protein
LQSNWIRQGDKFYVRQRGGANKEVLIDIGSIKDEKATVFEAIEDFHNVLERMIGLHGLVHTVQ